jgi:hypothetical protein
VVVFPVPVAPAIRPWRFAIPGSIYTVFTPFAMGTGSAVSGIQILCNYSIEDRYGLFGSGRYREVCIPEKWDGWTFTSTI